MPYAMHGAKNERDNNHTLVLLNKSDLLTRQPTFKDDEKSNLEVKVRSRLGNVSVLTMSCATGEGVDAVISALHSAATSKIGERNLENSVLITRPRHRLHLQACETALQKFCAFENTPDVAAEELRNAVGQLGAITGRVHVEQVLDVLFADFCIGK
jgi:tRNA modification GTPase